MGWDVPTDDGDELAVIDAIGYVARSSCRVRILELLSERTVASRDELQAAVDVVRTTLQRNLEGLADRGLVRERERAYELTAAGSYVAQALEAALSRAIPAVELRPVLERLPADDLSIEPERLRDATVYEATPSNPYQPVERHASVVADADHARLVLPATAAKPTAEAGSNADGDTLHEVVATPDVVDAIESDPSLSEAVDEFADGSYRLSVYDGPITYFVGVLDDVVQIGVHDDGGLPAALLESTDAQLRAWAIDRFESLESEATRLR